MIISVGNVGKNMEMICQDDSNIADLFGHFGVWSINTASSHQMAYREAH